MPKKHARDAQLRKEDATKSYLVVDYVEGHNPSSQTCQCANTGILRLHQACIYEPRSLPSPRSTQSPRSDAGLYSHPLTTDSVKCSIMQRLGTIGPTEIALIYSKDIDLWFPFMSLALLQSQVSLSLNEMSIDVALLSVSIILLNTNPPSLPEDPDNPSDFKSLYLCIKSWISLIEGLGINSLAVVQSRILVTLFEVGHGFYPAAYISIGSTIRAADTLMTHSDPDTLSKDELVQADEIKAWGSILLLDRYVEDPILHDASQTHSIQIHSCRIRIRSPYNSITYSPSLR